MICVFSSPGISQESKANQFEDDSSGSEFEALHAESDSDSSRGNKQQFSISLR